jgi:hypothetical protein
MTVFEIAIGHIAEGSGYSWDVTVLLGLGIALSTSLREKVLAGQTCLDDAAYISALYARKQLALWRG